MRDGRDLSRGSVPKVEIVLSMTLGIDNDEEKESATGNEVEELKVWDSRC